MIWLALIVVPVAVCALLLAHHLRRRRCPVCGAPRQLADGTKATFCPNCGHWYDKRLRE